MTSGVPDRWKPDLHMVEAVLAMPKASKKLTEMDMPDRCWLVAGLTAYGWTAKRIAEATGCSERLSKAIRAEPAYQVAMIVHEELKQLNETLHATTSELSHTVRELQLCSGERERIRNQFDQLIQSHVKRNKVTAFRCGHPQEPFNMRERGGKRFCRECDRLRQQARRNRAKAA